MSRNPNSKVQILQASELDGTLFDNDQWSKFENEFEALTERYESATDDNTRRALAEEILKFTQGVVYGALREKQIHYH